MIEASEFNSHDIPKINPGVVVISQSGETKDLITAVEHAKNAGAFSIGMYNLYISKSQCRRICFGNRV